MTEMRDVTGVSALQRNGVTYKVATTSVTVDEYDASQKVVACHGTSIPSAEAGYAVGCTFKNDTTGHLYVNQGSVTSCTFNDLGAIAASEISLAQGSVLVGNSAGLATAVSAKADKAILVGNGTTVAPVQMTGDVTITNAGVTAIGATKVTAAMLATAIAPTHVVKFAGTHSYGGGGTSSAETVTGVLATDVVQATVRNYTNVSYILKAVPTTNTVTFTWNTDPGASTTVDYVVLRAIA